MLDFVRDRSRAAWHDDTTTISYIWRDMEVRSFLSEHQ